MFMLAQNELDLLLSKACGMLRQALLPEKMSGAQTTPENEKLVPARDFVALLWAKARAPIITGALKPANLGAIKSRGLMQMNIRMMMDGIDKLACLEGQARKEAVDRLYSLAGKIENEIYARQLKNERPPLRLKKMDGREGQQYIRQQILRVN
jgi:hypothetical protein